MTTFNLYDTISTIQLLPTSQQQQIADFVNFLKQSYRTSANRTEVETNEKHLALSDAFGMIKTNETATLEELQEAVELAGAKL